MHTMVNNNLESIIICMLNKFINNLISYLMNYRVSIYKSSESVTNQLFCTCQWFIRPFIKCNCKQMINKFVLYLSMHSLSWTCTNG